MPTMPRESSLDSTLAFLSDGYAFISKRCERHGSDCFEARLLLEPTICMRGQEPARLFYDPERFMRAGAVPSRAEKTLFGKGGVQGMDGPAHRHRKAMFLSFMGNEYAIARLAERSAAHWREAVLRWRERPQVVLLEAAHEVLCRAVCEWAGVPLPESAVAQRAGDLAAMVAGTGAIGFGYLRAREARRRSDAWAAGLIRDTRAGRLAPSDGTALAVIAHHRDLDGRPLVESVAAVELINVLRPVVAVARFMTFAAHALHEHPECVGRLNGQDIAYADWFVQEVRRYYPFFPAVGARVREELEWQGIRFPKGRRVLLDLYGTNHDPRLWHRPERFQPERFCDWEEDAYAMIPQGGGTHDSNHRCAGEWLTIALLRRFVQLCVEEMRYEVPPQDLSIDLARIPAAPASGLVMTGLRLKD